MNHETTHKLKPQQTNWQVLTGAPCSGKTTVIEKLAGRGYRVVHEVARAHIDRELAKGRTLSQVKTDPADFERRILLEKVRIESELPPGDLIFLDRAVPDSIAYYHLEGLDPTEALCCSRAVRYKNVFFMERLSFKKDDVRSETEKTASHLDALTAQAYTELGYNLIHVPKLTIDQRVAFILRTVLGG